MDDSCHPPSPSSRLPTQSPVCPNSCLSTASPPPWVPHLNCHHHPSLNRKGRWGTIDDFMTSFLFFFPVLHCPLGLGQLQACPFPVVVFPLLPLSALSSKPYELKKKKIDKRISSVKWPASSGWRLCLSLQGCSRFFNDKEKKVYQKILQANLCPNTLRDRETNLKCAR